MKPLGAKERKDLFFQYLIVFTISAGILIFAFFFTRDDNPGIAGMDEQTQRLFNEFEKFEKSQQSVERLIDTVTAVGSQIITSNNDGSIDLVKTANNLINDFEKEDPDIAKTPFANNIIKLLRFNIKNQNDIKENKAKIVNNEEQLKDCTSKLQHKNQIEDLKQLMQQNNNPPPTEP